MVGDAVVNTLMSLQLGEFVDWMSHSQLLYDSVSWRCLITLKNLE